MPKPTTLILKPKYPHIKQIKIYYEAQFPTKLMLNDEIEKKSIKKKNIKNDPSQLGLNH